jgi:YD repeat-containing protein
MNDGIATTEKYDGVHFQVTLMNMRDGSVQGHNAYCADLKRGKAKFAEPDQANEVWDVLCKEDAREGYNADFDEETDGWYDIDWKPCADHIPAHREEAPAEKPAPTVTLKRGRIWTYVYDVDGNLIAEVRNDAFATVGAALGIRG